MKRLALPVAVLSLLGFLFSTALPGPADAECQDYGSYLKWISSLEFDRYSGDLLLHGNLAYWSGLDELKIIDVSDPGAMQVVGSVPTDFMHRRLALDWPYLYTAAGDTGIAVFDVADPAAPARIHVVQTPTQARDIALSGGYLYAACPGAGVQVYDLADPAAPAWSAAIDTPGENELIHIADGMAYVSDSEVGLLLIDVGDPAQPVARGDLGIAEALGQVAVDGEIAYVGTRTGWLVADVSDPDAPTVIAMQWFEHGVEDIALADGLAYVAQGYGGLRLMDLSDPTLPVTLGMTTAASVALRVVLDTDTAFVIDAGIYDAWLSAFDISRPVLPEPPVNLDTQESTGVEVVGDTAYVTSILYGLRIVDIADPDAPLLLGTAPSVDHPFAVAVDGDLAYVAGQYGLNVVDVSVPAVPVNLSRYDLVRAGRGVAVRGDYVFVSAAGLVSPFNWGSLEVFDISDPSAPVPVFYDEFLGWGYDIEIHGDLAYLITWFGLRTYDISNPLAPVLLSEYETPLYPEGLTVADGLAYLSAAYDGLEIVDVSDPAAPFLVTRLDTPGDARDVVLRGDFAYVADYTAGVVVIDVKDPAAPVFVGMEDIGEGNVNGARDLATDGQNIFTVGGYGLFILPMQCAPASVDPVGSMPTLVASVFPNPANPRLSIAFTLDRSESMTVRVYDLAGRRVATLADRRFTEGDHSLRWDGRTDAGADAPSGAYLVRLQGEQSDSVEKVMLLR